MSDKDSHTPEQQCEWMPEFTRGGRVSKMFNITDCGVTGASMADQKWKFCPYCGKKVIVMTWNKVYQLMDIK